MLKAKKAPSAINPLKAKKATAIAGPKNVDPKPLPKRRKPRLQVDPNKPKRLGNRQKFMESLASQRRRRTSPTKRRARAIPIGGSGRKRTPPTKLNRKIGGLPPKMIALAMRRRRRTR